MKGTTSLSLASLALGVILAFTPLAWPSMPQVVWQAAVFFGVVFFALGLVGFVVANRSHDGRFSRWRRKPTVERDCTLRQAANFIISREWPTGHALGGKTTELQMIASAIRQRAMDGTLTVWGKEGDDQVYKVVPTTYWANRNIDVLKDLMSMDLAGMLASLAGDRRPRDEYYDLMLSKEEVEAIWPPGEDRRPSRDNATSDPAPTIGSQ